MNHFRQWLASKLISVGINLMPEGEKKERLNIHHRYLLRVHEMNLAKWKARFQQNFHCLKGTFNGQHRMAELISYDAQGKKSLTHIGCSCGTVFYGEPEEFQYFVNDWKRTREQIQRRKEKRS